MRSVHAPTYLLTSLCLWQENLRYSDSHPARINLRFCIIIDELRGGVVSITDPSQPCQIHSSLLIYVSFPQQYICNRCTRIWSIILLSYIESNSMASLSLPSLPDNSPPYILSPQYLLAYYHIIINVHHCVSMCMFLYRCVFTLFFQWLISNASSVSALRCHTSNLLLTARVSMTWTPPSTTS